MKFEYIKNIIHENRQKILIILAILFIIGVIVSFKLIMVVIKTNAECLEDPFVYTAQRFYEQGMEINCACFPLDSHFSRFTFDRFNITVGKEPSFDLGLGS
ncbi:hypothetical protein LCGC14_2614110 [marine sediment metagenome]|uniref:Uncharacterized protein n=1 Tax=marine sediment metagenome TaxID=412755 RepID=A0A0F9CXN4_9ZZZZ